MTTLHDRVRAYLAGEVASPAELIDQLDQHNRALEQALAGMVYLYDRFGFDQSVRATTDPILGWLNIIFKAKQLTADVPFTPPADTAIRE